MKQNIVIIDQEYKDWIGSISVRYRRSQIKAAVKVNEEMLRFYWSLGRDIVNLKAEARWGSKFMKQLSADLRDSIPGASCFSETNLKYMRYFYEMYECVSIAGLPLADNENSEIGPQSGDEPHATISPQLGDEIQKYLFSIPWGHHKCLIDRCKKEPQKALFFIRKTIENGWSRDMLLNYLDTDLYEREGKALSNFHESLPSEISDLAQEMTKDPYSFAFTGLTGPYNERKLKDALLENITEFLLELGTGFAYVGKEYRLQIDIKEKFIDLLFYNLNLSCYVVVEVKIGEFDFPDAGQLTGYVVAANHILRKEGRDNPTIGILICKSKNSTLAQYALEGSNQPIAISEYDLQRLYPAKVEGIIPTIEEIEDKLSGKIQ